MNSLFNVLTYVLFILMWHIVPIFYWMLHVVIIGKKFFLMLWISDLSCIFVLVLINDMAEFV